MAQHYLVTGGAGFIGSHCCEALLAAGHAVSVLDNLSSGKRSNLPSGVTFHQGDAADRRLLSDVLAGVDGVFHLAAIASVPQSLSAWSETSYTNQMATIHLLEAVAKRASGPLPVVFSSSAAIYGDPPPQALPISERQAAAPLTPYGADKYGSELHLAVAQAAFAIPAVALRFFNVYGPRQDPSSPYSGVISIFANRLRRGLPITLFGDGEQTRDFIYVGDVVVRLLQAMQQLRQGHLPAHIAFNCCTGTATSVRVLAEQMAAHIGITPAMDIQPPRAGDIRHSCGNPSSLEAWLGPLATTPLDKGLARLLDAA